MRGNLLQKVSPKRPFQNFLLDVQTATQVNMARRWSTHTSPRGPPQITERFSNGDDIPVSCKRSCVPFRVVIRDLRSHSPPREASW